MTKIQLHSYERSSRERVAALKCTVCIKFQDQIVACGTSTQHNNIIII